MLDYSTWRELVVAFVRVQAERCGWVVHRVKQAGRTRSWYVELRKGPRRADVRVSDHRPCKAAGCRRRLFSVRQGACGRLADLDGFLVARSLAS